VCEIAEGFVIAALGPFKGRTLIELTSHINLPTVRDRATPRFGLGLNMSAGLVSFTEETQVPMRSEVTNIRLRIDAYNLIWCGLPRRWLNRSMSII